MPRLLSPNDVSSFRDRLCQAAERLFSDQGPASVTMRQLAIELGCSPMTPYRYFKDKDAILASVRASAFDRLTSSLQEAVKSCPADRASEAIGRAYVAFALAEPQTYRLMFDLNQPDERLYPDLAAAADRARAITLSEQPFDRQAVSPAGESAPFGPAQWAAVHGAVMLHLAGKLPAETNVMALAEVLLAGIRPTPAADARRVGRCG